MKQQTKTRRRGAELESAILDAAWAELSEVGYPNVTIEAVAARAGTSKPVIYRRWANRAELVLAAWGRQNQGRPPVPDTGELRGDLIALFTWITHRADNMINGMLAGVMGEAFHHPEVASLLQERLKAPPLVKLVQSIIQRGVERGELHALSVSNRLGRLPLDLIRAEVMMCGSVPSEDTIAELVDEVYLPVLHGANYRAADSGPAT